jgi:hypothetical protein
VRPIIPIASVRNGSIYACCTFLLFLLTFGPAAFSQSFRSPLILAPYSLDFGRVVIGKASNSQTVTLFNSGTPAQEISGVSITGDFTQTNNCPKPPATLAIMADCEIQITFKPSTLTQQSGTLIVSDATSGIELTVTLSGAGTEGRPTVTISPGSLTFSEQQTGVDSSPKTVIVRNTGTERLVISNVEVNGDFTALPTSTCISVTGPIDPDATCSVQIVFAPLAVGPRNGEMVLTDNALDSPNRVAMSGIGK